MLQRLQLYWHTVIHLKPIQLYYRIYYMLADRLKLHQKYYRLQKLPPTKEVQTLILKPIPSTVSFTEGNAFCFLNLSHSFGEVIDWNFDKFGKLWTYNLNYFNFLMQPELGKEEGLCLMRDYISQYSQLKDGLEPFTTSLRIINWIVFVCKHGIEERAIQEAVYSDYQRLQRRLELHLLGNHLLENAFALLFASYYFKDEKGFAKAENLLKEQLKEQTLANGAHFELSPMYHQLILMRVLTALDLMYANSILTSKSLINLLEEKAADMLAWLLQISFSNGDIPKVNDSAEGIAPNTQELLVYAEGLGISPSAQQLGACGYRKFLGNEHELLIDVGHIGPDYIPGHAHSDTLSFVLYHQRQPFLVDTGISTYEKNDTRRAERSTAAHNTVMVAGREQSEVWGGFRVGRRARPLIISESTNAITASHDGYKTLGIVHQRSFLNGQGSIVIEDELNKEAEAVAFLHFHPNVMVELHNEEIHCDLGIIKVEGAQKIAQATYIYGTGYNQRSEATLIAIQFNKKLRTKITLL